MSKAKILPLSCKYAVNNLIYYYQPIPAGYKCTIEMVDMYYVYDEKQLTLSNYREMMTSVYSVVCVLSWCSKA